MTTIVSWNVNGLRQRHTSNEFLPLFRHNPEIVGIQETKTPRDKIPDELRRLHGYYICCAPVPQGSFTEVMLFSRLQPVSVRYGFGTPAFDKEGRVIIADFGTFMLMNVYFPLGVAPVDTLEHKLAFFNAFLTCAEQLNRDGRPIIMCGDFSVAHTDNDVESVKKHAARQTGTSVAEREKMDTLVRMGFTDVHRMFNKEKGAYTWWPNGFRIPDRHLGRRLDYVFVNERMRPSVLSSEILSGVEGSDHCPVTMDVAL